MKQLALVIAIVLAWSVPARAQGFDLHIDVDADGSGAAILAARLPVNKQQAMTATYQQVLAGYRQLEGKVGLAKDELAGVLAAVVTGTVLSVRHRALSDTAFAALIAQFRSGLRIHDDVVRSLHLDRAPVREQLEIVGMLMIGAAVGSSPAAKQFEDGAKQLMTSYLQVDPSSIDLSNQGLVWTGAQTGPLALVTGVAQMHTTPGPPVAAPATTAPPADSADVSRQIVAFGTHLDAHYVGTTYTYVENEVWMFKDGMCSDRLSHVLSDGIAAARRDHPKEWTKCRRAGDDIEELYKGAWQKQDLWLHDRLPRGFTLDGTFANEHFQTTPGPYGGAYASWKKFSFDRSGRFTRGAGSGGSSGGVAVKSDVPNQSGTYAIDGFIVTLRYDDGHVEHHSFHTDPKKLDRVYVDSGVYRR